jgi:hypothetical protein
MKTEPVGRISWKTWIKSVFSTMFMARKWKEKEDVGILKLYMNIKVVRNGTLSWSRKIRWSRKIPGTMPSEWCRENTLRNPPEPMKPKSNQILRCA